MVSSKHNRVRLNTFYGNGSATSKDSLSAANSNNFDLGLFGASQNNLVEKNKIGGNINGLYLGGGGNVIGNIIRRNVILGNPPAESIREFGVSIGADIQDFSAAGTNTFEGNRCLSYVGAGPSPCPNVGQPQEDAEQEAVAAFVRNRIASQARVFNAIYHLNRPFLPKAAGVAAPSQTPENNSVTVTGKVVDAACFMLHAPAATAASHKDCGAACLARGVPLAIAADDGALYFPADGFNGSSLC